MIAALLLPADLPAIVIAAGGDGQRMGGAKPLCLLDGQTLLDHACSWAMQHSEICAIAVRDAGQVSHSALPMLIDEQPGIGPVGALASAMRFAKGKARQTVMLIGCDQPFLPNGLPARLSDELADHAVAMPVSGGKDQPLASLWRVDETAVAEFISGGGRSLWRLADHLGAVRIHWAACGAGHDPFANINDRAMLARVSGTFVQRPAV